MDRSEIKRKALKEIVQSILLPVVSALGYFLWVYSLIASGPPKILIFPLSGIIFIVLYFFSGHVYGGVSLGFLSVVGFLSIVITSSGSDRVIFFVETLWLWGLFLVLEQYRRSYVTLQNRLHEEEEILDTRITLLRSQIEDNTRHGANLSQRIANYQSLGRMVQTLASTIEEDRIIPLIEEFASRFIGKGTWKVKQSGHNDVFTRYIKKSRLPLIVQNLSHDTRFAIAHPRFASVIALPLEVNDRFQGILKGVAKDADVFDENDLRLLSVMGGIASLALHNAKLYQRTQELAITDGLTGLYVQKYFRERLAEEVLRSKSHDLPLSVAIIDVDFFKIINDTYGHAAGDVVLRQVAALLRRRLRETDFVARYGGEEFAVIMMQTDVREASMVCEDIRKCLENERLFLPIESFQPIYVRVTVSVGIALLDAGIITGDELLKAADEALYKAKRSGRNRIDIHAGGLLPPAPGKGNA
jgi:diguanylate cyclase (GGDEF)-like protein